MQIVIDIPEYEFKSDIEDNFQDFFQRVIVDISNNNSTLCGNYELETAQMLLSAFKYATVLPKGHGRLKDVDSIEKAVIRKDLDFFNNDIEAYSGWVLRLCNKAPTIIEADKEE